MSFKQGKCRRAILLLTGLSSSIALASPNNFLHYIADVKQYHPLVTLTVGPDFVEAGQAQNLTLLPPFQNHYTNNSSTATVADAGAVLRVQT